MTSSVPSSGTGRPTARGLDGARPPAAPASLGQGLRAIPEPRLCGEPAARPPYRAGGTRPAGAAPEPDGPAARHRLPDRPPTEAAPGPTPGTPWSGPRTGRDREIVYEVFLHGLSARQAGERLGIPEPQVAMVVRRACDRLRKEIAGPAPPGRPPRPRPGTPPTP